MTATETMPVMVRLVNSTMAGASCTSAGATWPAEQVGQSVHPSPEPESRTAAPVTTITVIDTSATSVMRR